MVGADALDSSEFGVRSSELNENIPYPVGAAAPGGPCFPLRGKCPEGAIGEPSVLLRPSGHAVGAPSASLRPCGRPRGTVLVCRVLWRMRGERIFFLFACPKRKNQRETTLGRGRLRFLPLPRPTLIETPKRGDPLLEHPQAVRIRPGVLYLPGFPAGRGQAPPLHGNGRLPVLRRGDSRIARRPNHSVGADALVGPFCRSFQQGQRAKNEKFCPNSMQPVNCFRIFDLVR